MIPFRTERALPVSYTHLKLVEIVKATYFNPKIVVVDETTTALSQEGREELYKQMNRVRDNGNTVIFISHDLPEILDKSDTITIDVYKRQVQDLIIRSYPDHNV